MLLSHSLGTIRWLTQALFFLSAVIYLSKAGVIKKRDTIISPAFDNLTELVPTILTPVDNASEVVTTKLQSIVDTDFATEISKELTNNEILINEAKKLLEEEDKIINSNNEKELKAEIEITSKKETDSEELKENKVSTKDSLKNIKEIIKNLETKEQNLDETFKGSNEFSSNDIKDDKLIKYEELSGRHEEKNIKQQNMFASEENLSGERDRETINSFENSIKSNDDKIRPSNKISTELRTENKIPTLKHQIESNSGKISNQEENIIENKKQIKDSLKLETMEENENFTNLQTSTDIEEAVVEIYKLQSSSSTFKPTNTPEEMDIISKPEPNLNQEEISNKIQLEFSTSPTKSTETSEVIEVTTITPISKPETILSQDKISNNIHDGLERNKHLKTNTPTITPSPISDINLEIFSGDKKDYDRSTIMENTTIAIKSTTTLKPIVLSIKESIEETSQRVPNFNIGNIEDTTHDTKATLQEILKYQIENTNNNQSLKGKKPKFINDNSTNAHQLNLPNNAEVWSLAAMKTLPKANVSLEIAQAHTETVKEYKEVTPYNVTSTMSGNSEKNLLDWSQIMMDKVLSTTTRNEEFEQKKSNTEGNQLITDDKRDKDLNNLQILDSRTPASTLDPNSLGETEQKPVTIFDTTMTTILSFTNDNNSVTDKKVEENMNNHIETLTEIQDTILKTPITAATTTMATNVDNNPFNTSLNTELKLIEKINLTSSLNPVDFLTTTVVGKPSYNVDAEEPTTLSSVLLSPSTLTEATAVVDMTTVEQNSNETTTVSTPETSKENVSVNNVVISQQRFENKFNNNNDVIDEEYSVSTNIGNNTNSKITNLVSKSIIITTTTPTPTPTTVVPITTFRPSILAIASTSANSSLPTAFEQEIDQNGKEIQTNLTNTTQQQQQSIIITTTASNLYDENNSTKSIETYLVTTQFETSTLETLTTTAAITITAELLAEDNKTKNNNTTSSSKEEEKENIISVTTGLKSNIETTTKGTIITTPSSNETRIGSPVSIEERNELEIETTSETVTATTTQTTKTPVVVIETQGVTALNESSTTTASTTTTEESLIETTTQQESEIKTKETTLRTQIEDDTITKESGAKAETATQTTLDISISTTTQMTTESTTMTTKDEETYISLLDDMTTATTITTTTLRDSTSETYSPPTIETTTIPLSSSTEPSAIATNIKEIYNVIHSTSTELINTITTPPVAETEETSTTHPFYTSTSTNASSSSQMIPLATTIPSTKTIGTADISKSLPTLTSIMGGNSGNMYKKNSEASGETDINVIIAITVSVIGVIALILLVGFLYIMRKRQKQTSYSQRCRPVSLDEYTIDNISVSGSMRKSSALRSSKRTYGNLAFDDPSLRHNPIGVHELSKFVQEKLRIFEEFRDVPQITTRLDEVPPGCEDKNRYANVLPLPETRVILQRLNNDDKTEYINANYVTGPKDSPNYYIACQAPLDNTVEDFWRMIWEQQSRVIIQATDLIENGVEKCAEYLPPSVTLDNHCTFGDFQITLQNREVKDKYAISTILLKHVGENATRELTHYWYKWPEVGVPTEEAPIIAMLLEARSSLISYAIEQANEDKEKSSTLKSAEEGRVAVNGSPISPVNNSNDNNANGTGGEINGNISMVHIKKTARNQGPLTVHCSPGTGRTGTIISCDIALRSLETPKRTVDIPQIVYYVRRGRASAVLTKEQYEFIYKVANMYASKITNPTNYN